MGEKPKATQILFFTTIYLKQLSNAHFSHLRNELEITAIPQGACLLLNAVLYEACHVQLLF